MSAASTAKTRPVTAAASNLGGGDLGGESRGEGSSSTERRARPTPRPRAPEAADPALVDRARAGDRKAFEILVTRYRDRIYSLCYSKLGSAEDALDATQDVFLRAYRAIERFEGKSQFYTWLFRIAINCAYTRRKRRHTRRILNGLSLDQLRASDAGGDSIEPADERDEPSRMAQRAERLHAIHEAIRALPDDYQQIVTLRDLQGFSYEEIGETLDMPIGSVKSRLHRARLQLRERLRRYFDGRS